MGNKANAMSMCSKTKVNRPSKDDIASFISSSTMISKKTSGSTEGEVTLADFKILKVLGSGAFGKVFLVRKREEQRRLFAMKVLRKEFILAKNQYAHTMTERKVLETLQSPFIVEMAYAFQTEDKLYFVMEFASGGELFFHL